MNGLRLAIGGDHRGVDAVKHVADRLRKQGHEIQVFAPADGASCDYPDQAWRVGKAVAGGEARFGLLFCGSGVGMCIAANKVPGIRAALVHDEITAEMSRSHNDANVVCISADLLGIGLIDKIVDTWLKTEFQGGRHARRVRKIQAIEEGRDPTTVTE